MRQPTKLPLEEIFNYLPDEVKQNKRVLSYRDGMGVAIHIGNSLFHHLTEAKAPYILEDYRMGMIVRGSMRAIVNLREYTMQEGTIVFVAPGTIVEPLEISDGFLLEGMGLSADRFLMAHGGKLPELFNGQTRDGRRVIPYEDRVLLDRMLRLLHDLLGRDDTSDAVISSMVTSVTHYFDWQFKDQTDTPVPTRSGEIFNRFLHLVNMYGVREHQLSFYADRLCITSRYLGTAVQEASGVGAKDWIDRAIISTAKVLLRHSDKNTAQIADALNFSNASFFCKFFKRITGIPPQRYRGMANG